MPPNGFHSPAVHEQGGIAHGALRRRVLLRIVVGADPPLAVHEHQMRSVGDALGARMLRLLRHADSKSAGDDIHPPEIRIPELVERGRIRRGELIHPQLKIRHPNRTGAADSLHLNELEVWFASERVSRFELTEALSDDPFISFAVLAAHEGLLEIRLVNNRGQRFEAAQEIRFS